MSLSSKVCAIATSVACATVAIASTVSPALAQDRTAWLSSGQFTNVSGYFNAGEAIYATCDIDCTDIDMYLYDASGTIVAADDAPDNQPYVYAPYAGNFVVQVTMPACYAEACAVAISSEQGF
ncbi:MAG: hypothetical protein HC800_10390 [Phormidesmis sp. RL_2_1]|nr:hypothetical protein [Phormidesmis sp. RL_2_1]